MIVEHQIDKTNDEFVQWEVRHMLLLELRARYVSPRRDGSMIFFYK
jgi:hypothetical protein